MYLHECCPLHASVICKPHVVRFAGSGFFFPSLSYLSSLSLLQVQINSQEGDWSIPTEFVVCGNRTIFVTRTRIKFMEACNGELGGGKRGPPMLALFQIYFG